MNTDGVRLSPAQVELVRVMMDAISEMPCDVGEFLDCDPEEFYSLKRALR